MDAATLISADALDAGDGGRVIVWSDERTSFRGAVTARGGPEGGDGGFVEVSGRAHLTFAGLVDLSAPAGAFGTLLLDPYDVFIEDGPTEGGELADVTPEFGDPEFEFQPDGDDPAPGGSVIDAAALSDTLEGADVTVLTEGDGEGDQPGTITVGAPVSWDAATTLTLDTISEESETVGDIVLAQPILAPAGGLVIEALGTVTTPESWTASDGTVQTGGDGAVDVASFTLEDGSWSQNAADLPGGALPGFEAGDFSIEDSFLRVAGGDGSAADPYLVADVYGLQGIGSDSPDAQASYALADDIVASATADWNDGQGFEPLPVVPDDDDPDLFDDVLDGRGFEISGPDHRPPVRGRGRPHRRDDRGGCRPGPRPERRERPGWRRDRRAGRDQSGDRLAGSRHGGGRGVRLGRRRLLLRRVACGRARRRERLGRHDPAFGLRRPP